MTRLAGSFFTHDATDQPLWWEAAPPRDEPGASPARTEIAIVGGGSTGLSAALTLARAGREVTVFEAEAPGWGASSCNAGILGPDVSTFAAAMAYGPARARAILEEDAAALAYVAALVAREAIACDLAVTGCFRGATSPRAYDAMGRGLDRIARIVPTDAYLVPRAGQRAWIGTDLYHGGLAIPGCAALHPGRYAAGLAEAARRAGARILCGARVAALRPDGGGVALATPGGTTRAGQVLVAANGSGGALVPWLRRRLVPTRVAMIATEPLPRAVMARLLPTRRMLAGGGRVASCLRASPDGRRLLFGGRVPKLGGAEVARANAFHLRRRLLRVFPELGQNLVSRYWHAETAFTFDGLPHLGEAEGIYHAGGYGGTGVAHATWFGHAIARRMMGDAGGPGAYEGLPFRACPRYRAAPWFQAATLALGELLDRFDAR